MAALPQAGVLRVVSPAALAAAEQAEVEQRAEAQAPPPPQGMAGMILAHYDICRRHRANAIAGWNERLLSALRMFNGQYDSEKLNEIRKFGGSTVFARVVAMKCRGASALLRDIYLSPDRPWALAGSTDPDIPDTVMNSIQQLIEVELGTLSSMGQNPDPSQIRDRATQLMTAAREAARKKSEQQAKVGTEKLDEILTEGGFYHALGEFLTDIPMFPFACLKGPTVKIIQEVSWKNGMATITQRPKLLWARVSPFDLYWTPGASDIEYAAIIERQRISRAELNDLLDLPGYNQDEVRAVLDEYGRGGIFDNWDDTDTERANQESRENPRWNQSGLLAMMEFHGNVQGRMLIEAGVDEKLIADPIRDYMAQAWLVGSHLIKVQLSPSPRKRHPYYITSFEKMPGSPVGNGLPDILYDIQETCNASLRSLINNASIASGPQVVINDDLLQPGEDGENLYPWKRWHVRSDPVANNARDPITFFMPSMAAQENLAVFNHFYSLADDLSGIPRYLAGSGAPGGAGRTASGLAMLMGNANKILQTVALNVDREVLGPILQGLYEMVILTDNSGLLDGSEEIRVLGVNVAQQRETQRSRQLEFLQISANPIDMGIMGPEGRAVVLRSVASNLGLDGQKIVPSDEELKKKQEQQAQMQQLMQAAAQAQGNQPSQLSGDTGPRTNLQQQQPQQKIAGGV